MDFCVVRTLKKPESAICSAICWFKGIKSIVVSYGKRLEFYNSTGDLLKAVSCNDFVVQISQIFEPAECSIFLLSKNNEYAILKNGDIKETGHLFHKHVEGVRPLKVLYLRRFLTILLSNSRVLFILQKDGKLIFYDKFNYFGSYKILDLVTRGEKVFFLMEDYENKVLYTHYGLKSSENDFMHFETGSFSSQPYRVAFYKEKTILFQKGKIILCLNNKPIYQSNFANSCLNSWIETEGGLLLSMRNGELIRLVIDSNIKIKKVHDIDFCIDNFLKMDNLYFGGSYLHGKLFFEFKNDEMRILRADKTLSKPKCLRCNDGLQFFARDRLCTVKYLVKPLVVKEISFSSPIKRVWIFNHKMFVSFPGKSIVYDIRNQNQVKEFDEIKNAHEYNGFRFNTQNLLVETRDGINFSKVEWNEIVLSGYHKDYVVLYSGGQIQLLRNRALVREKRYPDDIYMIFIYDFILVSTKRRECIFYDYNLQILKNIEMPVFTSFAMFKKHLFLVDKLNAVYVAEIGILKEFVDDMVNSDDLLRKVLPSDYHRYQLFSCEKFGYVLSTGIRPAVIILGKEFSSFEISISDITSYAFYAAEKYKSSDLILIARQNKILFVEACSFNPEITIDEDKIHGDVRFFTMLGKTNRTILGTIKQTKKLESRLLYMENNTFIDEYLLENKMVIFGEYFREGLFVAGFNFKNSELSSELSLFDVKKRIRKLHSVSSIGLLHGVSTYKNKLVTSHGAKMVIYEVLKSKLDKRASISTLIFPISFRFSPLGKDIFVSDMMRPLKVFSYNRKKMVLEEKDKIFKEGFCRILEVLGRNIFVADSNGKFFVYTSDENPKSKKYFYYGENVLDTCIGFLDPCKSKSIYFVTENGSIGLLKTEFGATAEEAKLIMRIQNHLKKERPFENHASDNFVDADLLLNIDIEATAQMLKVNASEVHQLCKKLRCIY